MTVEGAQCALHPGDPAERTCTRCGNFMCRTCSNRGVEKRCASCRPKYGPGELKERRLSFARRSPMVRCEACGAQTPPFFAASKPTGWSVVGLVVGCLISCGLASPILVWHVLTRTALECVTCGRRDELEPSPAVIDRRPENWAERTRVERARQLKTGAPVALLLLACSGGFVWFVWFVWFGAMTTYLRALD